MVLPFLDDAPVFQADPQVAHELARVVDGRIELVAHSRRDRQDVRVAYDVVLELGEAGPASRQDHREQIGQAELRRVAVLRRMLRRERLPEARHRSRGGSAANLDDIVSTHTARLAQSKRAVHVGLGDRAARVGFERELLELPYATEARQQLLETLGLEAAGEGAIEAVLALEDRLGPGEAGLGEQRGDHAGVSGPARVQTLGPRAVGQVFDDPRRLAPADPEGAHELVLGQPVQLSRGRGGREGPGESGRVVVARVELAGDREPDTAHHLDGGDDRGEHGSPGSAGRLADGETRGDRDRARMNDRVLARVVEVEPVSERGVREHRVGRRDSRRAADHGTLRIAAEALGCRARGAPEVVTHRGQTAAQRIERQETGLLDDRRRQVVRLEPDDEAGEAPRGGGRHGVPPRTSRSTSSTAEWMRPLVAIARSASNTQIWSAIWR